jgi:hypothetical protein
MTVTQIIYQAAGAPALEGLEAVTPGRCYLCGGLLGGHGYPYRSWVKPTFTDHDKAKAPESDYLCPGCVFCTLERSAWLQAHLSKDKPQTFRNYSHIVANGRWYPLTKADKAAMRTLIPTAEVVVIADSGQKHLAFRAVPGTWQFEEQRLWPDWHGLCRLLELIEPLYVTFSKTEIQSGNYSPHRIRAFGLERWRELEGELRSQRGSALMELALFLAHKEAASGARGEGSADSVGSASLDGLGYVGQQASEVLGDSDQRGEGQRLHQQPKPLRQLALFEDAGAHPGGQQG